MDLAGLGQQVKQKYPQYGNLSDVEVGQKVLAKYPQYGKQVQQGVTTAVEKTGLYDIPGAGGLLRGMIEPTTQFADQTMQKRQQIQQTAQTNPQQAGDMLQQSLGSGNNLQDLITGQGMARQAFPAAVNLSAAADIPGLASGAKNLTGQVGNASKLLTKGGAIAAQKAGASKGADILISDIENAAKQLAGDKQPKEVMDELKNLVTRIGGNTTDVGTQTGTKALTAQDILAWRQQLDSELPKTFWEQLSSGGNQARNKAIGFMRTALTNSLHGTAPGTKLPDKALGAMAKVGGDVPAILTKLLGVVAADRLSKTLGGPAAEAGTDIFTVLKMLGKI